MNLHISILEKTLSWTETKCNITGCLVVTTILLIQQGHKSITRKKQEAPTLPHGFVSLAMMFPSHLLHNGAVSDKRMITHQMWHRVPDGCRQ